MQTINNLLHLQINANKNLKKKKQKQNAYTGKESINYSKERKSSHTENLFNKTTAQLSYVDCVFVLFDFKNNKETICLNIIPILPLRLEWYELWFQQSPQCDIFLPKETATKKWTLS